MENLGGMVIRDEGILPSQYANAHRQDKPHLAERRLFAAVFELALKDWRFATAGGAATIAGWGRINRERRRLTMRLELEEWFTADEYRPGSFRFLADALGLDAGAVRAKLLAGERVELKRRSAPRALRTIEELCRP